ncbi:MAG: hypothetical protein QOG03_2395 [Actinomycetota bacterium]|jgi:hypothetical protein|nr:hypothetical protein [Actinomycetota bacterium]
MSDDKAREAAEHMQAATLQAIAAGRALLDLLEEAVQEPGPLLAVIATTVLSAQEAIKGAWGQFAPASDGASPETTTSADGPSRSRVQHIRVS